MLWCVVFFLKSTHCVPEIYRRQSLYVQKQAPKHKRQEVSFQVSDDSLSLNRAPCVNHHSWMVLVVRYLKLSQCPPKHPGIQIPTHVCPY